jgi:hypothetical protein
MNIPKSTNVEKVTAYINAHYQLLPLEYDGWEEWVKTPEIEQDLQAILLENRVG